MTDLHPGQQADILASAIRWIDDEPQPGIVEVEFVDCDGARHRLIDKCAIFGADTAILPTAAYPMSASVACTVLEVLPEGKASVRLAWAVTSADGRTDSIVALRQLVQRAARISDQGCGD